jgi:hypothetical protein
VPRLLRTSGAILLLPLYALMAWPGITSYIYIYMGDEYIFELKTFLTRMEIYICIYNVHNNLSKCPRALSEMSKNSEHNININGQVIIMG